MLALLGLRALSCPAPYLLHYTSTPPHALGLLVGWAWLTTFKLSLNLKVDYHNNHCWKCYRAITHKTPAITHKNVTLRNQNALFLCSLIARTIDFFYALHLPPNHRSIYHEKPQQLAYSRPEYSHIICTSFVKSSIMGLKRKSTWQKPGLTAYILPCEFKKKKHHKKE